MNTIIGYFFFASKSGGFTIQPWTVASSPPFQVKDSRVGIARSLRTGSVCEVEALAARRLGIDRWISGGLDERRVHRGERRRSRRIESELTLTSTGHLLAAWIRPS